VLKNFLAFMPNINDGGTSDFLERTRAAPYHCQPQFVVENLDHAIDALLAECT
jgi:hypothetical protein